MVKGDMVGRLEELRNIEARVANGGWNFGQRQFASGVLQGHIRHEVLRRD
jgi:hypothetical protein